MSVSRSSQRDSLQRFGLAFSTETPSADATGAPVFGFRAQLLAFPTQESERAFPLERWRRQFTDGLKEIDRSARFWTAQ
jgi:hypothetical protein